MRIEFTAAIREVEEGWIGTALEIPGINSQGATRKELIENLKEAAVLVCRVRREMAEEDFAGAGADAEILSVEV